MGSDTAALAGLGVLVTRPAAQADRLCRQIQAAGGRAYRFPVLEIAPPLDPAPLQALAGQLQRYDCAIFISANAVQRALDVLLDGRPWPSSVAIAVIGQRSADALQAYGIRADYCPADRFDSEGLLALPAMQQVSGKRFVIFRGDGGREYLADTLRQRGASVDYLEAYRRVKPDSDPTAILDNWRAGRIQAVLVNSEESLRNLCAMIGEAGIQLLRTTTVLVVSERMRSVVDDLALDRPLLVASNATDEAVMNCLMDWWARSAKIG